MGNKMKARIEDIETYILILDTGCHVNLEGCLCVPECARNLFFVSNLDDLGFNFKIGDNIFSVYGYFNLDAEFILWNPCLMLNVLSVVSIICMMIVLLICDINE
ncbi:hypothetical protein CR513_15333, partial [Mucuna pruriens]